MRISEIARICGVSETAIRKWCVRNNVSKVANKWNITETIKERIFNYYGVQNYESSETSFESSEPNETKVLLNLIENLQEQIKFKDKEIAFLMQQNQQQQLLLNKPKKKHWWSKKREE